MVLNSIVVLSLHSPKEKIWGELVALTAAGITIRGIDLNYFDEMLRLAASGEAGQGTLSTVFCPLYRVERMTIDEGQLGVPSLSERFRQRMGITVQEFFRAE